jgi:hypothetical protein
VAEQNVSTRQSASNGIDEPATGWRQLCDMSPQRKCLTKMAEANCAD